MINRLFSFLRRFRNRFKKYKISDNAKVDVMIGDGEWINVGLNVVKIKFLSGTKIDIEDLIKDGRIVDDDN